MKRHFFSSIIFILSMLAGVTNSAQAALITTNFSALAGNQGTVDIQLNLGTGETIEGFSLYFSEELFSDLSIVFSPLAWDSVVFQPDSLLGAGLFDSFNPAGLITGSARIAFTFIGSGALPALNYDLYNADFQIIESGVSTPAGTSVSESSSLALILSGLFALALHRCLCIARNRFHLAASH
ncbi:hypothetical protein [Cellvibrio mixtus]|uniref:hypothetical protein n=1 Tax=Cellvibrio mixtus TaxID=39650 RepID=UPI000586663C|nr:hypothetical protein [Cellvibrio mixtus]